MNKHFAPAGAPLRQLGVGIVEVMVSIAVGLFILAGVVQLYASSTQNSMVVSASSTIQENARYIFSRLGQDVSQSGYAGCFSFSGSGNRYKNIVAGSVAAGQLHDFAQFIDGENDKSLNGRTFDSVTLRYASAQERQVIQSVSGTTITVADSSGFEQEQIAVAGDCSRLVVFKIANIPGATGAISFAQSGGGVTYNTTSDIEVELYGADDVNNLPLGASLSYIYGGTSGAVQYHVDTSAAGIAAGQTCGTTNPQYCALYRKSTVASKGDELIEGVENFEVEYGWQSHNDGTLYYANAASVGANWGLIDRVKISATLNSVSRAPTNDGSTYISRTYARTFMIQNQVPGDKQVRTEPAVVSI